MGEIVDINSVRHVTCPENLFIDIMQEAGYADGLFDEGENGGPMSDDFWLTYQDIVESFIPFFVRWKLGGETRLQNGIECEPIDWDKIRDNKTVRDFILNSNK